MKISAYQSGHPCWSELGTTDWPGAKQFYRTLLGWEMADLVAPAGAFCMFTLEGDDLGAIFKLPEGEVSQWGGYFACDNLEATVARAEAAGGSLLFGPHAVAQAGRMAHMVDPQGARFSLWQADKHIGARRFGESGSLCWMELACREPSRAMDFYHRVFGWDFRTSSLPGMEYHEVLADGRECGGIMPMDSEEPANWLLYFQVRDCDAVTGQALSLDGEVCVPPTDIPNVGRFSVLKDPQGATFAVIALDF
ncbi:VOC family protein [Shewanella sedimentimangrovi]|uniref:VOC family protein n=1 Tax=Shewanella sedimentimangrovi TaxID=2814293 RepID=A0ABX7R1R8_9GAMM|nr:VOC family protein [Shewanella sedimentimangrovi]QSX37135.1 VOC family protein [Shewanella sedimentimangrovi]